MDEGSDEAINEGLAPLYAAGSRPSCVIPISYSNNLKDKRNT